MVKVRNNNVNAALRVFKRKYSDKMFDFKEKQYFEKPSRKKSKAKLNPELNYNTIYKKGELDIGINKDRLRIGFKKRF